MNSLVGCLHRLYVRSLSRRGNLRLCGLISSFLTDPTELVAPSGGPEMLEK